MFFLKQLLWPFALLYGAVIYLRNKMFDLNILKSTRFALPVIGIGNLNTGGSGKSPMTEYLLGFLSSQGFKPAMLSRGYGRHTKGYRLLEPDDSVSDCGDEPLQIKRKFTKIPVAVCEDRVIGITELLFDHPETDVIVLDDAFQHRWVKPSVNILLTQYSKPFFKDYLLPVGNLREWRTGKKRAHLIVVTKCPVVLTNQEREQLLEKVNPNTNQSVFFSSSKSEGPFALNAAAQSFEVDLFYASSVIFISAIAGGNSWTKNIENGFQHTIASLTYPDHHQFTKKELDLLNQTISKNKKNNDRIIVVCTEKDAVKLGALSATIEAPCFYFGVSHDFKEETQTFQEQLIKLLGGTKF
jgi:tetraacyldisaccharide 4'-kinase